MNKKSIVDILGSDIAYDIIVVAGQSNAEVMADRLKHRFFLFIARITISKCLNVFHI